VCSRQSAIQIHVYLYLYLYLTLTAGRDDPLPHPISSLAKKQAPGVGTQTLAPSTFQPRLRPCLGLVPVHQEAGRTSPCTMNSCMAIAQRDRRRSPSRKILNSLVMVSALALANVHCSPRIVMRLKPGLRSFTCLQKQCQRPTN